MRCSQRTAAELQDAVVAANLLSARLKAGEPITERDLAAVQRQRELPTRIMQTFQALVQERVSAIVGGAGPRDRLAIPAFVVPLLRLPWALALPARFIAYGFCPPRLRLPKRQAAS
jgi:hypothetical protein